MIRDIRSIEVLDSRGFPTVAVKITLESGTVGYSIIPSGTSSGKHEIPELRDSANNRYFGKGVKQACNYINTTVLDVLKNRRLSQQELDHYFQTHEKINKYIIGANASLGVSLAFARACAYENATSLYKFLQLPDLKAQSDYIPTPMINIINGGAHADNALDIQEFMIIPSKNFNIEEQIRIAAEIFHNLRLLLKADGYNTNFGYEGGFAPDIQEPKEALDYIMRAIEKANYKPGVDIFIGLDVAASELYYDNSYHFQGLKRSFDYHELLEYYQTLLSQYPIISIEDGYAEDDFLSWQAFTAQCGQNLMIVSDDLTTTNIKRLRQAIAMNLANAILIKPNQIGTLTETIEAIQYARQHGWETIISHRSGDTEDNFIAHLAVACGAAYIKAGSLSRSERTSKYNELICIFNNF